MTEQEQCGATDDCLKDTQYAGLVIHTCELPKGHEDDLHAEYRVARDGTPTGFATRWDDNGQHRE